MTQELAPAELNHYAFAKYAVAVVMRNKQVMLSKDEVEVVTQCVIKESPEEFDVTPLVDKVFKGISFTAGEFTFAHVYAYNLVVVASHCVSARVMSRQGHNFEETIDI